MILSIAVVCLERLACQSRWNQISGEVAPPERDFR